MARLEHGWGLIGGLGAGEADLEDDPRTWLFAATRAGAPFALATIVAADGGPRPVGAQMVITRDGRHGFLSSGCIEADVARHACDAITDGQSRRLVYGQGSPYFDLRLPCGRRLDVLVERIEADDPALRELTRLTALRRPAIWRSDGRRRTCRVEGDEGIGSQAPWTACVLFEPRQRLVVVGSDAFALAIASLGLRVGWQVALVGSPERVPPGLDVIAGPADQAVAACRPDPWTAVAVALHDTEAEVAALVPALRSGATYVGAMGSRSRLAERREQLRAAGLAEPEVARLQAPMGLYPAGRSAWDMALSVTAEIARR